MLKTRRELLPSSGLGRVRWSQYMDCCPRGRAAGPMIDKLIELALRNRFLVVAAYLALAAWGAWALLATPVDAIPDLSDNQGHCLHGLARAQRPGGRRPGHLPAHGQPAGLAGVRVVRSQSAFGFFRWCTSCLKTTSSCTSRAHACSNA